MLAQMLDEVVDNELHGLNMGAPYGVEREWDPGRTATIAKEFGTVAIRSETTHWRAEFRRA